MSGTGFLRVRRALLSASDKTGLLDLAAALISLDIELLSTGGTHRLLRSAGIHSREVSELTEFPEIMDGRVKTLHPKIHGGILGRRGIDEAVMAEHGIEAIDLIVVNLYPFEATAGQANVNIEEAIENIDIGGPAMVRAAAKNYAHVAVVVDPADYGDVCRALNLGGLDATLRRRLATKAFAYTARYDSAVAGYLSGLLEDGTRETFPGVLGLQFHRKQVMRYGENPHQRAAFYVEADPANGSIAAARQIQGKDLSYNNVADADAALECVKSFAEPACVIVKHANPCGVAISGCGIGRAYDLAFATDPTSAFGGVIAFNRALDSGTARSIVERQFVEVVIAPEIEQEARDVVSTKGNVRLLESGYWSQLPALTLEYKGVVGGLLAQERDMHCIDETDLKIVTKRAPSTAETNDLIFAWKVAKYVKSNAIVYAKDGQTVGIGAGQMSRVLSAKVAAIKAAEENLAVSGSVMASDAFFPFRDGIDAAADAGIRAVIQPGGSKRDEEVITAADEAGMAMVFTGVRHFRH